jgi:hypothetical protein
VALELSPVQVTSVCGTNDRYPAISPNVGNSNASFLLVEICVRANLFTHWELTIEDQAVYIIRCDFNDVYLPLSKVAIETPPVQVTAVCATNDRYHDIILKLCR